ncbi:hypothetical protein [Egicoccus halophilus]|uniref:Uncharacterized protein n=1 Tax=Egicoccus halophilus TaxID=1670830 RepID=A0A8J3AH07_9ACTN|nr:hypothetical protein [Egicoccus halophilus]GGI08935.1 hypothetical protein GCM10011354_31570 [Egicoccus halophilus]
MRVRDDRGGTGPRAAARGIGLLVALFVLAIAAATGVAALTLLLAG